MIRSARLGLLWSCGLLVAGSGEVRAADPPQPKPLRPLAPQPLQPIAPAAPSGSTIKPAAAPPAPLTYPPNVPAAPASNVTAPPAPAPPPLAAKDIDRLLDVSLEHYYAHRHAPAASGLYALVRAMPETELRRDTVEFYLAASLVEMGFAEAGTVHYVDIITGRRSPELVARSLGALDELVRRGLLDESRLIEEVLFGNQFGDLPAETAQFVEYHQGLGELRRGFENLGIRRLEELSAKSRYWGWKSRYALAVERLARDNLEGAEKLLVGLASDEAAPRDVKNDALAALARMRYEQKKYVEAFELYAKIDSAITSQDLILIEKAWTKVAERDERRALGMVVGLGAPVYRLVFAPERSLINAVALDRLCQFRAAHLAVLAFRRLYAEPLQRIRDHRPLADSPMLRQAAMRRVDLLPTAPWRSRLAEEKKKMEALKPAVDQALVEHLKTVYDARLAQADAGVARGIDRAVEKLADQLLTVDEQMTILDYEIGVGLFKGTFGDSRDRGAVATSRIPTAGDQVYFHFDGEYWSDEINDFEVHVDDRCLR